MAQGKKKQKSTILEPELQKLFMDALKDIFWAEKALLKALPKINKAATNSDLQKAISGHLQETQAHVTRLEEVFELLGEKTRGKKCEAMAGLIAEGESIVDETEDGSATRDVGIIMAAQKVEHYEIATYGSLVVLADTLGLSKVSKILAQTLGEEKQADLLMTEIAESHINFEAKQEAEG